MRILMLSTSYDGTRGPAEDEADSLRADGHEVDVVRLDLPRSRPGAGLASRVPGVLRCWLAAIRASLSAKRYDRIEVETSPPLAFAPFAVRTMLRGERLILCHWDIFPENLTAFGLPVPAPVLSALGEATRFLFRAAGEHRTLSPAMAGTLSQALGPGIDVRVAPLLPPPMAPVPRRENRWLREHGLADRFVVMYAGNLGRAYDFAPVIAAAEELAGPTPSIPLPTREGEDSISPSPAGKGTGDGSVAFVFVGTGFREREIRAAAARLSNVILLPPQPEARLSEVLCAGDAHVVPLRPGAEAVMWPHKVDALVRLGRPVLAVGWGAGAAGVEVVEAGRLAEEIRKRAAAGGTP